jgi:hypothetical protein
MGVLSEETNILRFPERNYHSVPERRNMLCHAGSLGKHQGVRRMESYDQPTWATQTHCLKNNNNNKNPAMVARA